MDKPQVKIGEWIENGFNLYKDNVLVLIVSMLLAAVLSCVTFGILTGPMTAGLIVILLALFDKKEPKPEIGDVFKGFTWFLPTFLFFLAWGVILIVVSFVLSFVPCIGQLATIFAFYAAQALLMFAPFLMVEKGMDFWPASMESINRVKANFWPFLGFSIVAGLIGSIGALLCGIGVVITAPLTACMFTVAYRDVFSGIPAAPVMPTTPQAPAQPPPQA